MKNNQASSIYSSLSAVAPIAILLLSYAGGIQASSLSISYGQLKQHVSYANRELSLAPAGSSISLSLDLNDHYSVDFDYQSFADEHTLANIFKADSELKSWGAGVNYFKDNWSYSASFNQSTDDVFFAGITNMANFSKEDTESTAFGVSIGYGWAQGSWFYNTSAGLNYSDWQSNTNGQLEEIQPPSPSGNPPRPSRIITIVQNNEADALSFNSSFSVARFWSLTDDTGIFAGALLSWSYTLSGDEAFISQIGRNNSRGGNNTSGGRIDTNNSAGGSSAIGSVSGDDNYGQLSLYVSYDLTSSWSIDVDTGFDFGTDTNDQTWSVTLGYFF